MNTYEILEKALALIEREENWMQGGTAIDGRHCAVGALTTARGTIVSVHDVEVLALSEEAGCDLLTFNDSTRTPR